MFAIQISFFSSLAAFDVESGKPSAAIAALQTYVMSLGFFRGGVDTALAAWRLRLAPPEPGYPEEAPLRADLLLSMRSLRGKVFEGLWFL